MVKTILDDCTVEKVSFEKTNEPKNIWSHVNKKQIESKFGGLAENVESSWLYFFFYFFFNVFILLI